MRLSLLRVVALVSLLGTLVGAAPPLASAQSAGWNPGPGAILENTYDGFIDTPANGATVPGSGSFTVSGWFVDKQAQGWAGADDVQIWLGTMDGGGRLLTRALFAQNRPDVASATGNPYWAASGFAGTIGGLPAGSHTLNVYVHTGGKGWWYKGVTVNGGGGGGGTAAAPAPAAPSGAPGAPTLTVTNPAHNQNVSTKSDYTIQGTVSDPRNTTVNVWINGERDSRYGSDLGVAEAQSDGSWSLTFRPTRFPSTHSNLYIYARNRTTGQETLIAREFNIVDRTV
jgi:hypothetical protein